MDGTVTRTAVGSAGRNGGPMTVPSIQVGDDVGDEDAVAPASERAGTPPDGRTMATSVNGGSR